MKRGQTYEPITLIPIYWCDTRRTKHDDSVLSLEKVEITQPQNNGLILFWFSIIRSESNEVQDNYNFVLVSLCKLVSEKR